jgi:hypothetical protein
MLSIGTPKSNLEGFLRARMLGEATIFSPFMAVLLVTDKIRRQFGSLLR